MMTSKVKEFVLEDFIEEGARMKLTTVKSTNPFQIESYEKPIENVNPMMYRTIVDVVATTEDGRNPKAYRLVNRRNRSI